jgi:hypothetical protein
MHRHTRLAALTATAFALATAGALAQDSTQSIEVRSSARHAPRTDVQALCPEIENELPDTLATIARRVAEPALLEVRFSLEDRSVSDVVVSGGPAVYQRAVRRAVRGLVCRSPDAGRQSVALRVQFIDPYATLGQPAVALLGGAAARCADTRARRRHEP